MGISLGDQVFVGDANPDAYVSAFNAFDRLMFFIFYLPQRCLSFPPLPKSSILSELPVLCLSVSVKPSGVREKFAPWPLDS